MRKKVERNKERESRGERSKVFVYLIETQIVLIVLVDERVVGTTVLGWPTANGSMHQQTGKERQCALNKAQRHNKRPKNRSRHTGRHPSGSIG